MRVETNSIKKTTGTKRNIPVKLSKNIICCISQKNIFTYYNNILANGALNMVCVAVYARSESFRISSNIS